MNKGLVGAGMAVVLMVMTLAVHAKELYFVDAHSQFDTDIDAETIIEKMDQGGVYKTILASRRKRRPREAAEVAEAYPDRVIASIRTKGRHYSENTKKYYKKLKKQVKSGRFNAMAELMVFHAQKGDIADEVRVSLDDRRITTALAYAKEQGWPFVVHIEFAALSGSDRAEQIQSLKTFLADNADHPIALIHMGQLPTEDAASLIKQHKNLYFLTSHADTVAASSNQPWINMMAGNKFTPQWKQLIAQNPTRFVFALDNVWAFQWLNTYMEHIKVWRSALADLPENVAHAVAHGNAERLWKLTPKP